ncbi:PREDICTED: RBBP8 N-terminal-like protein [Thamnophis sirtalis]|uniref:RBBP8 N-terminal-like protein n=1 Tax=Thamnophis sirtalis TaxID=35019 RepID=A0A6I9X7X2_9SAUR|nr:PREDICTED: RBBP8 N-terminal-like protein [Thamnophis sirtalis]
MATENFAEILNRLKETHEKEVQGLQTKLNELTNEKCRDNQRIEELFTKNHQLREQQKGLKENVKVLENRLRAGLCDRCQVTQEVAKKKQHEFMKAHFQGLQHIFILTNELNKLREENKSLKEDLKRLYGPDRSRKPSVGKNVSPETEDEYPEPLEGDESPEHRLSPESRISPNILLHGDHALDMSSQKRVNQFQETIELMRTGSRTSSQERDYPGSGSPPLTSKTPPSPHCDQSLSLEAFLRANKSDCRASPSPCENLRLATKKEQLYLFNQSLAVHHLGLRNKPASKEGGDFPHHLLLAKEVGSRMKPQEEWENQAAILELPGAVLYMKDHHLENRLQLLNSSEKLRCFLMQQEGKGRSEESSDETWSQTLSLSLSVGKEGKKERLCPEDSVDDTLEQRFQVNRENPDRGEEATSVQDHATEAPLDLSDYGRGRESGSNWHHRSSVKHERRSPGGDENEDSVAQKTSWSSWLGRTQKHHYGNQQWEQFTAGAKENTVVSPVSLLREPATTKTSSQDSTADTEVKMPFRVENQDPERPGNGDSDSLNDDSDETAVSESEMVDADEEKAFPGGSIKEDYCNVTKKIQNLQKKRKRGHDSSIKAYKKSAPGGESDTAPHILPGPKDTKEMPNHSPPFGHEEHVET